LSEGGARRQLNRHTQALEELAQNGHGPLSGTGSGGFWGGTGRFNAMRCRADVINIGKVACPTRSEFRGDKIVLQNEKSREAGFRVDHGFNAPFPSRIKIDAGNIGKNINASQVVSEANKAAAVGKIPRADVLQGAPNSARAA
jgi:hypothetical protein